MHLVKLSIKTESSGGLLPSLMVKLEILINISKAHKVHLLRTYYYFFLLQKLLSSSKHGTNCSLQDVYQSKAEDKQSLE